MRKFFPIIFTIILACFTACRDNPSFATFVVDVSDMKEQGTGIHYDGQLNFITRAKKTELLPGPDGTASVSIELDRPGYYMIFRNPLYISPGDELVIDLNDDNEKTIISGKGSQANTYLSKRYYSKGGSFLDAGRLLRPDAESMTALLDTLANDRRKELDELKGVTKEFKRLERARITADYINSLFYYPIYSRDLIPQDLPREDYMRLLNEYHESLRPRLEPLLQELASDDSYLDIEVVRLVLFRYMDIEGYDIKYSDRFLNLVDVADKAGRISGNMTRAQYDELLAYGERIPYDDMKAVYMDKLQGNTKLMPGRPAVDVALRDGSGKTMNLSDLADKPMYVDVWATWCGPCLAEAPHFERLSREYPGIRFVSLSVDENTGAWERHIKGKDHGVITEVLSLDRAMRQNWDIAGIPRFLLIDADFNIISAGAPRPSSADIRSVLDQLVR